MIDTTCRNVSQSVVYTTHGTCLSCRIVLCCCLHINLLSLPLTLQRYNNFRTYANKTAKKIHFFTHFPISTHYVKGRFTPFKCGVRHYGLFLLPFYCRFIVDVGITLPAIPSARIARLHMSAINKRAFICLSLPHSTGS